MSLQLDPFVQGKLFRKEGIYFIKCVLPDLSVVIYIYIYIRQPILDCLYGQVRPAAVNNINARQYKTTVRLFYIVLRSLLTDVRCVGNANILKSVVFKMLPSVSLFWWGLFSRSLNYPYCCEAHPCRNCSFLKIIHAQICSSFYLFNNVAYFFPLELLGFNFL